MGDAETESLLSTSGDYRLQSRIADEKPARFDVDQARRFLGRPPAVCTETGKAPAAHKAKIATPITVPTLRHLFAT